MGYKSILKLPDEFFKAKVFEPLLPLANFHLCLRDCTYNEAADCLKSKNCGLDFSLGVQIREALIRCTRRAEKFLDYQKSVCRCFLYRNFVRQLFGKCLYLGNAAFNHYLVQYMQGLQSEI